MSENLWKLAAMHRELEEFLLRAFETLNSPTHCNGRLKGLALATHTEITHPIGDVRNEGAKTEALELPLEQAGAPGVKFLAFCADQSSRAILEAQAETIQEVFSCAYRHAFAAAAGRKSTDDTPIIGANLGLRPILERVRVVAKTTMPVLLLGETGSGKEVIARAIHQRSDRRDGPFLRVNCGAIAASLIDSELFGHERGSFTGATGLKRGWFERAHGGTLFLDEIGEMSEAAQVRMLRVLQDGIFERVGGERDVKTDVRIVAATHRDLEEMVARGEFRRDLWYRIAVFPIQIPALRERTEDMPELATYLVDKAARKFGLPRPNVKPGDIESLCGYSWPGNIRELNAVIERAVLLSEEGVLGLEKALGQSPRSPTPSPTHLVDASRPSASREDSGRERILRALRESHGRVEGPFGAAQALGMNPNTLRSRMRRLGIQSKAAKRAA